MTMKTRKLGGFFLIACCALLLASPLAFAGGKKGDWEVGLFTGYGALDDYEQSGELPPLNPESDILFGLRFGYFLTEGWSLETSLQRLSTSGSFRPFLTVGAGLEAAELDGVFNGTTSASTPGADCAGSSTTPCRCASTPATSWLTSAERSTTGSPTTRER
jgi:hypothetical protein